MGQVFYDPSSAVALFPGSDSLWRVVRLMLQVDSRLPGNTFENTF